MIALYEADYAKHWDAMLADLNLVPLRTPEQAAQDLYILGSPQSPMRDLLASIARQLTLSQPPPAPSGGGEAEAGKDVGKARSPQQVAAPSRDGAAASAARRRRPPARRRSRPASRSTTTTARCATMSAAARRRADRAQALQGDRRAAPAARQACRPAPAAPTGAAAAKMRCSCCSDEASRDPQPVARWLEAMAASGTALISGSTASR